MNTNTLIFADLKARLPPSFLRHFNGWEGFWVATLIFRVPLQGWATPLATWNFSTWGREEGGANGPRWLHLSTPWLNWCSRRNTHETWEKITQCQCQNVQLHLQWYFIIFNTICWIFFLIESKNYQILACVLSTVSCDGDCPYKYFQLYNMWTMWTFWFGFHWIIQSYKQQRRRKPQLL